VYWMLTFGDVRHVDPVSLRPEMREFTVYVDGISKAFAATGVRVGWVVGPQDLIDSMNNFMGHVGTWAPRAEQIATAKLLDAPNEIAAYGKDITGGVRQRLDALHDGITAMRAEGLPVDVTAPMGAIYLSARFALNGKRTPDGQTLRTNDDIRRYLLKAAGFAVVPFQAFGVKEDTGWVRLSVGAVSMADIERVLPILKFSTPCRVGKAVVPSEARDRDCPDREPCHPEPSGEGSSSALREHSPGMMRIARLRSE